MSTFQLVSQFKPTGDQPHAIEQLSNGVESGMKHQTLLGVTGSGKTFTMANIIQNTNRPALILAHNKTLAAQLYSEFQEFFPNNHVEYFVSYYDYYQPEAYIPRRDLFIEKESDINESIERYRNAASQAVLTKRDTIIVASVSCIYGLGNPETYLDLARTVKIGESYNRSKLLRHLTDLQYERSEIDFSNGDFRVRGDTIDIYLASEEEALRIEFFGDQIESIKTINPLTGEITSSPKEFTIFPAKQFTTAFESLKAAIPRIREELKQQLDYFKKVGKDLEAHRLSQRVNFDIEMLLETGYCAGIENYSRFIDNRLPGSPPSTLLDYFPDDFLLFVDESHMTIPQVRGMYNGDRARKEILVEYGFRLPAAKDNRPLRFEEFSKRINQAIYVSATPAEYEIELAQAEARKLKVNKKKVLKDYNGVAEQLVRPTGLIDPVVFVRPTEARNIDKLIRALKEKKFDSIAKDLVAYNPPNQIDDIFKEVKEVTKKGQRVLITTLTKRMSEDLTNYLKEIGVKVQYLHSEIDTVERVEILRDLRLGKYDVIVGINLLREGIDLPEVSLVAILDADKEGFLRSRTSLLQTMGRAARHEEGRVILYADTITDSMAAAMDETIRRKTYQEEYNKKHGITPKGIKKAIKDQLTRKEANEKERSIPMSIEKKAEIFPTLNKDEKREFLRELEVEMTMFADMLEFEKAAEIRDIIDQLSEKKAKKIKK